MFVSNCISVGACTDIELKTRHDKYNHYSTMIEGLTSIPQYSDCQKICQRLPTCVSWDFRKDGVCWFQKSHGDLYAKSSHDWYTLGSKTCGNCEKRVLESNNHYTVSSLAAAKVLKEQEIGRAHV